MVGPRSSSRSSSEQQEVGEEEEDDEVLLLEMNKLYIGNLPAEANEASLRQLLQDSGCGTVTSVLVKRGGYAFVDCPEQATVEKAIEKLNGMPKCDDAAHQ